MCVTEGHQRSSCDTATAITHRFKCLFIRTQRHVACFVHDQSTRRRMSLLATQRRLIMQMPLRCCAAVGESSAFCMYIEHSRIALRVFTRSKKIIFIFVWFLLSGHDAIHALSKDNKHVLRIDQCNFKGEAQATSSLFFVEDEAKK